MQDSTPSSQSHAEIYGTLSTAPSTALAGTAKLSGRVARVSFRSTDNTFHVIIVEPDGAGLPCRAISRGIPIWAGQAVMMTGTWRVDKEYGEQFESDTTKTSMPATEAGLRAYLASGAFHKLGKVTADRLVRTFGIGVVDLIKNNPTRIADLPGLTKKFALRLQADWKNAEPLKQEDDIFLRGIGMTTSQLVALNKAHGAKGAKLVQADPYLLIHTVKGIGFQRADVLAAGLGVEPEDEIRIVAGIFETMRLASEQSGHCLMPEAELEWRSAKLLKIDMARIATVIATMDESRLEKVATPTGAARAIPRLAAAERRIAEVVLRIAGERPPWQIRDMDAALRDADIATGKPLTGGQRLAFAGVLRSKVSIVNGGPGVGKTTLMRAILHALSSVHCKPRLTAPTGRSAMNMMDATGIEADTINLILGQGSNGRRFRYHRGNPLVCDILFVDESSMADVTIISALLDALPKRAGLVMIGDIDQLEPVGPGRPFGDIIDSGTVPVFRLTEVKRQAANSRIKTNCHLMNEGLMPVFDNNPDTSDFLFFRVKEEAVILDRIIDLASRGLPKLLGVDAVRDVQVLSPMNVRNLGVDHMQPPLRAAMNPNPGEEIDSRWVKLGVGDKVIHTKNNYRINVRNGEIGIVRKIDVTKGLISVEYGRRIVEYDEEAMGEVRLGYAVSVHKSQGSEYPAVVMPMVVGHQFMLRRRLLRTAASRARRMMVMIGHIDALAKAVADVRTEPRYTQLKALLEAA